MPKLLPTLAAVCATFAIATPLATADEFTPGNVLLSTNHVLYEYTTAGVQVQTLPMENAPGHDEVARDLAMDGYGAVDIYNGTFEPWLSTYNPEFEGWGHRRTAPWSTVNNVSYGGLAVIGEPGNTRVFVTDMNTAGDPSMGVMRYHLESTELVRFAQDIEPIDLNIGHDGLLYVLYPGGSPEGRLVDVYEPFSVDFVRTIDLTETFGHTGHRAIAVNAAGELFVADWDGDVQRVSPDGVLLDAIDLNDEGLFNLIDIDVSASGVVVVGDRFGGVAVMNESFGCVSTFTVGSSGVFVYPVPGGCLQDLDGSGAVDFGDILAILAAWGNAGGAEDLDCSGTVNFGDLLVVLGAWGACA